jgi:regulator of protease activity HflC (stomatin/prohibitin superfamily)
MRTNPPAYTDDGEIPPIIKKVVKLTVVGLVFIIAVAIFGCSGCTRIGPGHVGIEVKLAGTQRGAQDFVIKTGWVFYNPLSTSIIEYPTYIQTAKWTHNPTEGDNPESPKGTNEEISFNSSEGMTVRADISMSYHLLPEKIPDFYVKFRNDNIVLFTHGYLRNLARNAFNDAGEHYRIEEIIGAKKEQLVSEVTKNLQKNVTDIGVVIDQLGFIESPRPPDLVMQSINMKVQATQLAMQKQNELVQAQAEAAKAVAYAEGDAKSQIARAQGQATANKLINESLTDKVMERTLIDLQYKWVEKWDGSTPFYISGQGGAGQALIQLPSPARKKQ